MREPGAAVNLCFAVAIAGCLMACASAAGPAATVDGGTPDTQHHDAVAPRPDQPPRAVEGADGDAAQAGGSLRAAIGAHITVVDTDSATTDAGFADAGFADAAIADTQTDVGVPDADSTLELASDATSFAPLSDFIADEWQAPAGMEASPPIGCSAQVAVPAGQFVDVAAAAGVNLVRPVTWPAGSPFEGLEVREGGGQALADFDGDGQLDIYFAVATGDDRLYLAQPGGTLSFKGFSIANSGIEEHSAVAADLDNDGDADLVIGGDGVRIYRNDGPSASSGVTFTDVSMLAQLGKFTGEALFGTSVADLDRDGWLDVVVAGHRFEHPISDGTGGVISWPHILHGTGGMVFEDKSAVLPVKPAITFVISLVDLDGDGDQDLYFGNDFGAQVGPNQLLRNDSKGPGQPLVFTNVSALSGTDIAGNTMGIGLGDVDHDGSMDLFVGGWTGQNSLLHNASQLSGLMAFDDATLAAGGFLTGSGDATWGVQLVDVDSDGWLDTLMPNGHLVPGGAEAGGGTPGAGGSKGGGKGDSGGFGPLWGNPPLQADNLYIGKPDGSFSDVSEQAGFAALDSGRALSVGDIDRDGFADLVLGTVTGAPHVYRNGCSASAAWLHVRLNGVASNRSGIGARVTVIASGITYIRDIEAGSTSVWCSGEPAALFGLGSATVATQVQVRWPSGKVQSFADVPLRRRLLITEQ